MALAASIEGHSFKGIGHFEFGFHDSHLIEL